MDPPRERGPSSLVCREMKGEIVVVVGEGVL